MEKYYVPSIEEFYVGFEYEEANREALAEECIWNKCRIEEDFATPPIINQLYNCRIRVKYLDHEDIVECGWNREMENTFTLNGFGINYPQISKGGLRVFTSDGTVFDGTIRNKSELKVLMRQLNIS